MKWPFIFMQETKIVMIYPGREMVCFIEGISMGFDQALEHFETAKDTEEKHDFIDDNSQNN